MDIQQIKCDAKYTNDIVVEIRCLDINKTCGMDGIYAEHLKHCDKRIVPLLAMCITGFFVHGFLLSSLLSVVLVPIIKDKRGKINSKDKYRSIALASIVSKNVENILLDRCQLRCQQCSIRLDLRKNTRQTCVFMS